MILARRRWQRPPAEKPLPLFDRGPTTGRRTSELAERSIRHALAFIEQRIVDHLQELGPAGATADEAELALDLAQATGSARFSELTKRGLIIRTNRTRPTRRGRAAFVHVHPSHQRGETCQP